MPPHRKTIREAFADLEAKVDQVITNQAKQAAQIDGHEKLVKIVGRIFWAIVAGGCSGVGLFLWQKLSG